MKKMLFIALIIIFSSCLNIYADGLGTLVEVGKDLAETQKAWAEQTQAFERVKQGVDSGAIRKGQSKSAISGNYGEPVITTLDKRTNREEWVYMPASSTFFKGVKIYLYFDKNDALDEIKAVE
jgi:hypothetical protein